MRTGRPLTFDEETIQQIRDLAKQDVRATEIAKAIGRDYKAVWSLMKRLNIPRQPHWNFPKGEANPSWNGGRMIDKDGYVLIHQPDHPHSTNGGYVREHRLVMENMLGRYLDPKEVVHHKDKNKQNNVPDNLGLYNRNSDHLRHELTGKVPNWSPEGMKKMRLNGKRQAKNLHKRRKQKTTPKK
ncbi:MAG: hypothetical protein GY832_24340 [Chloroflexi bacterium]|nr:hypothetical protein [Chloroflexota bacterium]